MEELALLNGDLGLRRAGSTGRSEPRCLRTPRPVLRGIAAVAATITALTVGGSHAGAADNPVRAVTDVIDALAANDFMSIPPMLCPARRTSMFREFDLESSLGLPSETAARLVDAIDVRLAGGSVVTKAESADLVVVGVNLGLEAVVDSSRAAALISEPGALLEGDARSPAAVVQELVDLLSPYGGTVPRVVADIDVVRVDEEWLVCSDFRPPSGQVAAESSPVATSD